MARPEILFLFPGFTAEDFSTFILSYHLGTGYILAYLREKGIHAAQFIHREPIDLYTLTEKILQQKPKIVGFSCYDTNYYFVKLISQLLKKKSPKLTIIAGGPTATFSDKLIMQDNPVIDICVRGEGELTTYELLKQLRANRDTSKIEGITYRSKGRIAQTPDRPLIRGDKKAEGLDILPSPYLNGIYPADETFRILTSRGCIFRCVYCNCSAMSRWTIRYHSAERVIAELKVIERSLQNKNDEAENRLVEIWDDAFSLNIERAKKICRRIIEEKINLPLWAQTRPDRIDRELLCLMYQAGFQEIYFGLESTSPKVLNTIKRVKMHSVKESGLIPERRYIEKLRKNVRLAQEIGLNPTVGVIMGLPGATIKDDEKTMAFVKQLRLQTYYHSSLNIYSGTELFKTHKRYGLGLRPTLTVFPHRTEHTYDVDKIPEMESSRQSFIKRGQMERVMRIITGDYRDLQGDGYPDVLLRDCPIDSKMIEWLNRSIAICPVMGFVGNHFRDRPARKNMKRMISSGLPVVNLYFLTPFNKKDTNPADLGFKSGRYELIHAAEILSSRKKSFSTLDSLRFIPFARHGHNRLASLDMRKKSRGKIIFSLSTLDDIKGLVRLTSHSEKVVLEGDMAKFDCYFLDECRWSDKDCPAARFRRAIIEKDGSITPCFNGKPIAKVGDERGNIIKNLRLLWDDVKRKRGCKDCPAKDSCSKCLFPYPMNEKEYCQMRRKMYSLGINKTFKLLKIVRRMETFSTDIHFEPKPDKIVGVFDNGLAVVDMDKKRYLYHYSSGKFCESLKEGECHLPA